MANSLFLFCSIPLFKFTTTIWLMGSLCHRPCICIIPLKPTWSHCTTGEPKWFISANLTPAKALVQLALLACYLIHKQYKTQFWQRLQHGAKLWRNNTISDCAIPNRLMAPPFPPSATIVSLYNSHKYFNSTLHIVLLKFLITTDIPKWRSSKIWNKIDNDKKSYGKLNHVRWHCYTVQIKCIFRINMQK